MTEGHSFTILHPDESGAFNYASHEPQRKRWARLMRRGRQINREMLAFAAGSRARLAAIEIEYPDTA